MEFVRRKRRRSVIELTPLIDVVFQLLVFFLLTASFVRPSVRLDLPSGTISDEAGEAPIVVDVGANGELRIDGEAVARSRLESEFRDRLTDQRSAVRLSGDRSMSYELFVEILDAARSAGAAQFDLVHTGAEAGEGEE
ncbi:MAG: biopolymer transporter ExbD [Planctomycetota bacterium]